MAARKGILTFKEFTFFTEFPFFDLTIQICWALKASIFHLIYSFLRRMGSAAKGGRIALHRPLGQPLTSS